MLSHDEGRRYDEIVRRIRSGVPDRMPPGVVVLVVAGLLVVGGTGVVTGLAADDLVILWLIGVLPTALAVAVVSSRHARELLARMWDAAVSCAEDGCRDPAVSLGWCERHVRPDDPGPDEYWGDVSGGDVDGGDVDGGGGPDACTDAHWVDPDDGRRGREP